MAIQGDSNVRDNHQYGESVTQELEGAQTPTDPLNFATLKEYVALQIAMSLTMMNNLTPDREGDVVS